ncbi:hypothetical protein [Catelliglobosispora koreensis]|uniref:hypothetical protein n=1 Tax=Catelliglobosispora koreensis TaxID=129052 RepID=UPI00035D6901|nr:hypothetical protein [Catelliglobosispora koreensis]
MGAIIRFFDRHGWPITRQAWTRLSHTPGYPHTALDTVVVAAAERRPGNVANMHTYWLGIGETTDLRIFRTIVFGTGARPAWAWTSEQTHCGPPAGVTMVGQGGPPPAAGQSQQR